MPTVYSNLSSWSYAVALAIPLALWAPARAQGPGVEICGNGLDDDGDGLFDGDDPDCYDACKVVANTASDGYGSLAQAIRCANADPGYDTIRFAIPTSDPGYDAGRGVYRIELTGGQEISDGLLLDGTTQTAFGGNTNGGRMGAGGTVGTDALALARVVRPEIEIFGRDTVPSGIDVRASGTVIRGIAVYGFQTGAINIEGNSSSDLIENVLVEGCVVGAQAHSFTLPPDASASTDPGAKNVYLGLARACTLRNNLIGFSPGHGIQLVALSSDNLITGNEVRSNARLNFNRDAIGFDGAGISGNTVRGNLVVDNHGIGVDFYLTDSPNLVENNTITGNGFGTASTPSQETAGVRLRSGALVTISRNEITDNYGAGVLAAVDQSGITISENSISRNGSSARPADGVTSGQYGIDLHAGNTGRGRGVPPYVTVNDDGDGDAGANGLLNFPVLTEVALDGDTLEFTGFAPAGAIIEVFEAITDPDNRLGATSFGEGARHVVSFTEGGTGSGAGNPANPATVIDPVRDLDAGRGDYSGDFGSATGAERFRFRIAASALPSLDVRDQVTATATGTPTTAAAVGADALGSTSEFSNVVRVVGPEICDNGLDDDGDGLVDTLDPDCYASCKVVTNTSPNGFGSLSQAIKCANAEPGLDTVRFAVPDTDPGYDAGRGVYRFELTSSLPPVTDPLLLDGSTQAAFGGNTNAAVLGTGGTVGVDALPLPQLDGPEIEVYGPADVDYGIRVREDDVVVRGLAIYGFAHATIEITGSPSAPRSDVVVEDCVIGSPAHSFTLAPDATPTFDTLLANVRLVAARACTLRNNLIGFGGANGVEIMDSSSADNVVTGNEFRGNGRLNMHNNAIRLTDGGATGARLQGNLAAANHGPGFDLKRGAGGSRVENNSIVGNGLGTASQAAPEWAGILVFGSAPNTLRRNVIADNYGAGIGVGGPARGQLISENEITGNGRVARPFDGAVSGQIGIDLTEAGPDYERGIAPYVTPNDEGDVDAGPNRLLNFPVIESAQVVGSDLVLTGFAPTGAYLELFAAAAGSSRTLGTTPFGQGARHIITLTEGGSGSGATHALAGSTVVDPLADRDVGSGAYAGDFGADSGAERFRYEIPLAQAGGLGIGDSIVFTATATAATAAALDSTIAGTTSEFSNAARIFEPEICDNGIDDDGDGLTDCEDPDCADALADADADVTTCPGQSVVLRATATAATPPITFSWDGGAPQSDTLTARPTADTAYVFTVTNGHGCSHSDTVVVAVDDPGPSFTFVPADETYACDALTAQLLSPDSARAQDGCGLPLAVTLSDSVVAGCGATETRYRTWSATDARGNTVTAGQVLSFADLDAPIFRDAPLDTVVNDAGDVPLAPSLVAEDACGPDITTPPIELRTDIDDYTYELLRTWIATDACGNVAEVEQVIRVELPRPELLVFNGFSPNGDGVNDYFTLANLELYPGTEVKVFNRWGNQVYASAAYDNSWDGRWDERLLPDGTYFYVVTPAGTDPVAGYVALRR